MAKFDKITEDQYILDCINKEHEIVGSGIHFADIDEMKEYINNTPGWHDKYNFTPEQYQEWKAYACNHYRMIKGKTYASKSYIERSFPWFSLKYGFPVE